MNSHQLLPTEMSAIDKELQILLNESNLSSNFGKMERALEKIGDGADVNTKNDAGDTFLHILVKNEQWLALDLKSDAEQALEDHDITQIIQQLIGIYEANPEIENTGGFTPLQFILNINSDSNLHYIPMLLVGIGFNPHTLDKNGDSLLHRYAKSGGIQFIPYIEILINKYKADIHLKNKSGLTPIEYIKDSTQLFVHSAFLLFSNMKTLPPSNETIQKPEEVLEKDDGNAANIGNYYCSKAVFFIKLLEKDYLFNPFEKNIKNIPTQLTILLSIAKEIASHNKKHTIKSDYKDIFLSLQNLAALINKRIELYVRGHKNEEENENLEDKLLLQKKADEIIQLIDGIQLVDEKRKQEMFSHCMHLFFSPESPCSQLTTNIKREVVETLECLFEKDSEQRETQSDVVRTTLIKI